MLAGVWSDRLWPPNFEGRHSEDDALGSKSFFIRRTTDGLSLEP
ncbi:MAG: hypothetical protein QOJ27_2407 [Sphingomonadales bacterium]|nr:hypothetical protein [Sphingomonadales bacterium]